MQPRQIIAFFYQFDIRQHFKERRPEGDGTYETKCLDNLFFQSKKSILRTYWFHLTRVLEGTSFQDGIFPLNDALPSIWEMLYKFLSKTQHAGRLKEIGC